MITNFYIIRAFLFLFMSYAEVVLGKKYKPVTLVYSKRFVLTQDLKTLMPLDIRDFCRPSKSLEVPFLTQNQQLVFSNVMQEGLTYVTDNWSIKGALDEWQLPEETNILRKGDCEDMTFYRAAKIQSNNPSYIGNIFCALGFVKINGKWFGHAFPILVGDDGIAHIYEATANNSHEQNAADYDIFYILNHRYCYEVKKGLFGVAKRKLLKEFGLQIKKG